MINRLKERVKIRLRRALANPAVSDEPLAHVVVAGGSVEEWSSFGTSDWSRRISALVDAVEPEGVKWLTLVPLSGREASPELSSSLEKAMRHQRGRVQVIVRSHADGRKRFAEVVDRLHRDEQLVGRTKHHNQIGLDVGGRKKRARQRPLRSGCMDPDTLPTSLVWELAYSEIVFLDIPWSDVTSEHVQMAVNDFRRRNRRFGGIDA